MSRLILLVVLSCAAALAQDEQETEQPLLPSDPTDVIPAAQPYVPLTLWQNYAWSVSKMFNPGRFFLVAAKAAIDHSGNNPLGWGQGFEGYADRAASRAGWVTVNGSLAFAVRALDHEDPRYFPSHEAGVWKRARYATIRVFVARNESGGTMPAYSTFIADFTTPFLAQMWRPERVNVGREVSAGAFGLGSAVAGNVYQEFSPEIKKALRKLR